MIAYVQTKYKHEVLDNKGQTIVYPANVIAMCDPVIQKAQKEDFMIDKWRTYLLTKETFVHRITGEGSLLCQFHQNDSKQMTYFQEGPHKEVLVDNSITMIKFQDNVRNELGIGSFQKISMFLYSDKHEEFVYLQTQGVYPKIDRDKKVLHLLVLLDQTGFTLDEQLNKFLVLKRFNIDARGFEVEDIRLVSRNDTPQSIKA